MNIDAFIKAAEGSRNYHAFAEDMQRCKMTSFEIYQYVENRYIPGMLNPFDPRT